ncbi:hypothetical protein DKP78_14270 [Enterococcus faecium]|nr:hypothetical protein DKP78_14270 [Enterococcus faecium]
MTKSSRFIFPMLMKTWLNPVPLNNYIAILLQNINIYRSKTSKRNRNSYKIKQKTASKLFASEILKLVYNIYIKIKNHIYNSLERGKAPT